MIGKFNKGDNVTVNGTCKSHANYIGLIGTVLSDENNLTAIVDFDKGNGERMKQIFWITSLTLSVDYSVDL
jgi:hypothetical protein